MLVLTIVFASKTLVSKSLNNFNCHFSKNLPGEQCMGVVLLGREISPHLCTVNNAKEIAEAQKGGNY